MKRIGIETAMAAAALAIASWSGPVRAQEHEAQHETQAQRQAKQQQGVLQVGEITIVGRVQKPVAAVDVAKIQPKLTLAELRQPFLNKIEQAVQKEPF